jgi:hypothetical protein
VEYSTNFIKKFKRDGHKLSIDGAFSKNNDDDLTKITDVINERTSNDQQQTRNIIQADYVLPLGKSMQLEAGYRGDFLEQDTDVTVFNEGVVNTLFTNNLVYKEKVNALLTKAQDAIDNASLISPNNAEIMVVQAMLYTAILVQDPMTNGQKYSGLVMEQYAKALVINPNNPRAVFSKAEFEIGGAKYWGTDTKPMCDAIAKSIELFANFKPETQFHPKWGADRAKEALENCKK